MNTLMMLTHILTVKLRIYSVSVPALFDVTLEKFLHSSVSVCHGHHSDSTQQHLKMMTCFLLLLFCCFNNFKLKDTVLQNFFFTSITGQVLGNRLCMEVYKQEAYCHLFRINIFGDEKKIRSRRGRN